jgi:sterol desaturase/sphingolipid hydroxylase (fatty acid hydroxylase superfamily)
VTRQQLLSWIAHVLITRRYEFAIVGGAVIVELFVRSRLARRLLPPGYLVDLLYCALYRFGVYALLLDRPVNGFIYAHFTIQPLLSAPVAVRILLYLLLLDFANYWIHRAEHSVPALWAFHQVHHSQEHLSIMSTYRNHPLDMWLRGFVGPTLTMILVGLPPHIWLWLTLLWDVTLNLSHLEVGWTYGPLGQLVVSPVYHAIHHSVESRHMNRNFGANLVVWDRLFGTRDAGLERPAAVGLPGWTLRNSVLLHLWEPFRAIGRHYRGLPVDGMAPLKPAPPPAGERAP